MKFGRCACLLALAGSSFAIQRRSSKLVACPLLGQQYPTPKKPGSEPKFQDVAKTLEATLDEKIKTPIYQDTAFSVGIFSTSDDDLMFQYHHTSPAVANSSYGTNKIDADSIYYIGSVSKLLTVYMWLLHEGDVRWNEPVAKHLPELLKYKADSWNDITPDWNAITLGDLAGQMGGLARDYGLGDFAPKSNGLVELPEAYRAAFPHLPPSEVPKCGYGLTNQTLILCSAEEYLSGIANESPVFSPAYTPVYSNEAFAALGVALSRLTNTSTETLFNEDFRKHLGLTNTYYQPPDIISGNDVIPRSPTSAGWGPPFGVFTPVGGYISTIADFAKLGKDILLNRSLSKSVTNRWFKPTSFVEEWSQGVGRPWEIFRTKVNDSSVDLYTKSGDWGVYHSFFGLIPDYDIGFTVFTAAASTSSPSDVRDDLPGMIWDVILPVVYEISQDQAERNFAGTYTSKQTNSSLTLTAAGNETGIKVTGLVNNGVDLFSYFTSLAPNLVWRLVPNQLNYGDGKIGFTSFYESATPETSDANTFLYCPGWIDVDEVTYGNIPVGQIAIGVDSSGNAQTADLRALRVTLGRES